MKKYDCIVIGSGPGGEGAAMQLSKNGKDIAVVEKYFDIGGGCTHWGTIPSKSLRHGVRTVLELRNNPLFANQIRNIDISYSRLLKSAESVINQQSSMRRSFYERNRVDVIGGYARFLDKNTIEVENSNGAREKYQSKTFVLATGSRPYHPNEVDFTNKRILDSDSILNMDYTPRSVTIYGAGVIGCEYASILKNLGIKINLINTREKLLSFLDDEIIDALSYHLRNQGVVIRHNELYEKIEVDDNGVVLWLQSGKKLKSDALLWANGRTGNSQNMGLEDIGIEVDHRGYVKVNNHYQTKEPNIYAVGDIVGFPSLASASYDQGRYAASKILKMADKRLLENIPTGIYTSPEISSLGKTERELTAEKVPYEVGQSLFRSLARAQITNHTVGMLKILFHRETLKILGIHCFGYQASEIIHIGQAVMSQKGKANTVKYFVDTTFNYPTMAEAYRVAALNGLNRLF
ncbi:Si-specific NAD(P)(+) transhydrogenase [Candidatus Uabimicrobium amorphum]|uniref:Soluble pyridine nucleotide transhydrogenase n=1 Tax=Uabimicrobium amorphum TaxID=2596890 RepID=A0A5S9F7N1_UABAM|nr:Si-specific NAD(P)(+) transhydrogenase [Candidatus Uabimicrobium amorphum]BBM87814.1 soluble pyridine nucleotide transhydrogenase [Candidatus Uabimicrobium amorphum]